MSQQRYSVHIDLRCRSDSRLLSNDELAVGMVHPSKRPELGRFIEIGGRMSAGRAYKQLVDRQQRVHDKR